MTPVAVVESPLRRSDQSRLFRTPRAVSHEEVNDDEAERRIRRSAATLDDSTVAGGSTVEDNENIKMCLQLYSDNKLSKDNAWSVTIIDTFSKLMARHSNTLQNFQVAGSTLEASTKVYGLRVDSVHTDVMRMCSELTRQSARAMDNNREDEDEDDGADKENDVSVAAGGADKATQEPKAKKKRARKVVSTITKNKDSINAPLDTNPFTDPFFAKLNSVVGDVNSTSRLMQNLVPTENAELRLRMDYPFWDDSESPELNCEEEEDYNDCEKTSTTLYGVLRTNKLHQRLAGYVITDTPAEDEDDEEDKMKDTDDVQLRDGQAEPLAMNRSALDVQFDIDAEVEPVPVGDAYIIDYASADAMGGPEHDDEFNDEDQIALQNCRGLKRKTVLIEDMRPIDSSSVNLEYSYRALDNISQFWAGPSHWKFKRSKNPRSMSMRHTLGTTDADGKTKQKVTRKKKRFEVDVLDDMISVAEELFPGYNPNRPVKNITHLKSLICKKWDSKKLKLPTDFHLERNRFDVNKFARGMKLQEFDAAPEPDVPVDEYDYSNPVDQNYCSRVMNDEIDPEADPVPDFAGGSGDDHQNFDDIAAGEDGGGGTGQPLNTSLDFIPTEFQGAPDRVMKINIAYAKTAKVVDMKQLKSCCWRLIQERTSQCPAEAPAGSSSNVSFSEGKATFTEIFRELPHILSKSMSENISKSLAFYSVLHLTNERSLRLVRQEDLQDFTILPPA
ncbi:condensin complex subunit 2 [Aedes albopictus]|uniref:Condensin complex subunit 2 n=1 Tax=Aedes albopictus TaxID=7160 RepID=A0ABM1YQT8_AEDAL|nr:condensin complex subunit 2 [Aedes albopictus]